MHSAAIIGVGQSAYTRRPEPGQSTHTFIRDAVVAALADAGVEARDVQGMAVASFSLAPDTAVDLAWKLGLPLRWLLQDTNGGSSAMNMLGHALRGIEGVQTVKPEGEGAWRVVADRDVRAAVAQRIVSAGGALTRLADLRPSLEEVYTRYFQEARHAA